MSSKLLADHNVGERFKGGIDLLKEHKSVCAKERATGYDAILATGTYRLLKELKTNQYETANTTLKNFSKRNSSIISGLQTMRKQAAQDTDRLLDRTQTPSLPPITRPQSKIFDMNDWLKLNLL